jgi:hypothetical protein
MPTSRRSGERSSPSPAPVKVLSVPESMPITVRFLANLQGLDTHWINGTVPCPGREECPPANHRRGVIWKGYAAVQAWDEIRRLWVPFVLEITECAEEYLRDRELRAEVWTLFRAEKKGKTDAVVALYCGQVDEEKLSPPFDIVPVLCRVFHVDKLKLGRPNPIAPRLLLEPVAGEAPPMPTELLQLGTPENTKEDMERARELLRKFKERGYKPEVKTEGQDDKRHERNGQTH